MDFGGGMFVCDGLRSEFSGAQHPLDGFEQAFQVMKKEWRALKRVS